MPRRLAVVALAALLAVTATAPLAAAGDSGAGVAPQTTPDGFDSTTFEITVYENGSARWTFRYTRILDNASQRDAFREFADTFETTESDFVRNFRTRARRLTAFGTNATGREMTATAFQRRAFIKEISQNGVVELSFRWTNFADTTGDTVVVADVFDGGMYLGPDQSLVFSRGPGLAFTDVRPDPDSMTVAGNLSASTSVTFQGQRDFADARPRIELAPPGSDATSPPAGDDNAAADGGSGLMMLVLFLVVLVGGGVGLAWYSGALDGLSGGSTAADSSQPDAGGADSTAQTDSPAEPTDSAVPEGELLSDEDRVLNLLESNGGRMKQVDIVDETDWSKSKVSMLLSDMEEEGEISKLRVGRENIISLSGEEPDAAGSPFDDE